MADVTCFVCGHRTLDERCDWDVCPVCFWEDDVLVADGQDVSSSANGGIMVSQAQANFMLFGAISNDAINNVRPADENEGLDPAWKPLDAALELVEKVRTIE